VNKSERDDLIRLVRLRAKQARSDAETRAKILAAEIEDLMAAQFEAEDELWVRAVVIAEKAAVQANERIAEQCARLGIPPQHAPGLELRWRARSPEFTSGGRRAELRKLAQARLAALTAAAKSAVDGQALDAETALVAGSLESEDARAVLDALPTAEQLMPALSLDDLGVRTWQPPAGAASALLTPSTTADRKRRRVMAAIEAHPGWSDRRIAEVVGVDHKTVTTYRRRAGETARELPGEGPGDGEPGGRGQPLPPWATAEPPVA
jgi:hypothetical protein